MGTQASKEVVVAFNRMAFGEGKLREAAERYVREDYIQHSPNVPDGRDGMVQYLSGMFEQAPDAIDDIKRVIAEGDFVVLHHHLRMSPEDRGAAFVEIYRVQDGQIAEHWDVMQPVPEQAANDNTMF
jgi:predicted SnoaL-like aldol condensation-catalyzing enzyme